MRLLWILACLSVGCTAELGDTCTRDKDCGSGLGCYRDVCVEICANDRECHAAGARCERYRCVKGEADPSLLHPAQAPASTVPPVPDTHVAELRAIRHELEALRADQARILELLEGRGQKPPASARQASPLVP